VDAGEDDAINPTRTYSRTIDVCRTLVESRAWSREQERIERSTWVPQPGREGLETAARTLIHVSGLEAKKPMTHPERQAVADDAMG
jgi:hypothetical protein